MDDWNIQTRNNLCSQCQGAFNDKDVCHTLLLGTPEGYQRQDICATCWKGPEQIPLQGKASIISHWQGVYEPPPPPPVDPLPKEDAESILRRMLSRNDPTEFEARYILAVMLERKRILKHRETQKGAGKLLVYEHAKTGEVFMVPDPELKLTQLEEVQKRVAAMLHNEAQTPAQT